LFLLVIKNQPGSAVYFMRDNNCVNKFAAHTLHSEGCFVTLSLNDASMRHFASAPPSVVSLKGLKNSRSSLVKSVVKKSVSLSPTNFCFPSKTLTLATLCGGDIVIEYNSVEWHRVNLEYFSPY